MKRLVSISEAASALGISNTTLRRWEASGSLAAEHTAGGEKFDELPLSMRKWISPSCGAAHNRDQNAAINLKNRALSSTVSACGEEGAGRAGKGAVKLAAVKQGASRRFSEK
jgi:putative transposase